MTVNSLTSVSLDPCLLLICPRCGSVTDEAIKASGCFAVNILAEGQQDICGRFAGETASRFSGMEVGYDGMGVPRLPGSLANLSCVVADLHQEASPIVMQEIHRATRGSRYVELPDAGDLSNVEEPALFAQAVLGFRREVKAGRPGSGEGTVA